MNPEPQRNIADLAVVGAGPAGLAVAIGARLAGLSVLLADRAASPIDKACGEGVMPVGLAALDRLGVLGHLDPGDSWPIRGIRYVDDNGRRVEAALPAGGGLGIRRLALSRALFARAREVGVDVREHAPVRWRGPGRRHELEVGGTPVQTHFLVAADGLHSALRRQAGLEVSVPPGRARRFGMRQHFAVRPWTDYVEVHFAPGVEAYVTGTTAGEVMVAFLYDARHIEPRVRFEGLLRRFPALLARVAGATPTSRVRGLGSLECRARAVIAEDLALVGDAAGYVDAITGEGISLGLETAAALVAALARQRQGLLRDYARAHAHAYRKYAFVTRALLWLAAEPRRRHAAIALMSAQPRLFRAALGWVMRPDGG